MPQLTATASFLFSSDLFHPIPSHHHLLRSSPVKTKWIIHDYTEQCVYGSSAMYAGIWNIC